MSKVAAYYITFENEVYLGLTRGDSADELYAGIIADMNRDWVEADGKPLDLFVFVEGEDVDKEYTVSNLIEAMYNENYINKGEQE